MTETETKTYFREAFNFLAKGRSAVTREDWLTLNNEAVSLSKKYENPFFNDLMSAIYSQLYRENEKNN